MRIGRKLAHVRGPVAFWALAGVALLVSHDAIFLAQIGPGEALTRALREAGHDYWALASLLLAGVGIAAALATLVRLRSLRRRAAELAAGARDTDRNKLFARVLAAWPKLFAVVAIGFVLQENIEHLIVHGHAPALGALGGQEYPLALPVIGLITAVAAVVASTLHGSELELLAVIAAAMHRSFGRAPRHLARPPALITAARISPMALAIAGRAPPGAFVQPA